jgi:hypothetical protein
MNVVRREPRGLLVGLIDFAGIAVEMKFHVGLFLQSKVHQLPDIPLRRWTLHGGKPVGPTGMLVVASRGGAKS